MRILHYTLGFPPYRSGGLVRYAKDLSLEQAKQGHTVSVLSPGFTGIFKGCKSGIIFVKTEHEINYYEIAKAFPPPLLHGIKSPQEVILKSEALPIKEMETFYEKVLPEVLHVHTLMSLPLKLIDFLKSKGVKIIFSSHDYFGLCLRVNFINYLGNVCDSPGALNCGKCNASAKSTYFLRIRNIKSLLKVKNFLGRLSSSFAKSFGAFELQKSEKEFVFSGNGYNELLKYYHRIFECVDVFHFNSEVSKQVYERHVKIDKSIVLPVTHSGIKDNRSIKSFDSKQIRFGFIGSLSNYKGFPFLKKAFLNLPSQNSDNWKLIVWGNNNLGNDPDSKNIQYFGKFESNNLAYVFSTMDVLIVPSICKETFSLIVLEALSYGVPVLVSRNVGAKNLISSFRKGEFVFELTDEDLNSKLSMIISNPSILVDFNRWILDVDFNFGIETHARTMSSIYRFF